MDTLTRNTLVPRPQCPACAGTRFNTLIDLAYEDEAITRLLRTHYHKPPDLQPLEGFSYALQECLSCSLAFQAQVPGPDFLPVIYDQWISPVNLAGSQSGRTLRKSQLMAAEIAYLIRHLGMTPGKIRVLDFGAGWSEWASMARAWGCQVCVIDLSVERQAYARSIGLEVLELERLPADTFDFINTEQVFEHLTEPGRTIRQLKRALRPGGLLRISVPDSTKTLKRLRSVPFAALSADEIMTIHPLEHVQSFTPLSLERFGALAGLAPLRPHLRLLYDATSGWFSSEAVKALVRPLYRHVWPRTTIAYFERLRPA